MNARLLIVALVVWMGMVSGCSGGSSSDSGEGTTTGPVQACLDTADVFAKAVARCGGNYQANYDAFIESAAVGSCNNIIQVRDETSLRGDCFT